MNPVEIEMNFPAEHGGNVFGQFDAYMKKIEKTLHVSLILRGDHLKCIGTQQAVNHAISVIDELLELSKRGNVITEQNVNYALSLSMEEKSPSLLELDKESSVIRSKAKQSNQDFRTAKIRRCDQE